MGGLTGGLSPGMADWQPKLAKLVQEVGAVPETVRKPLAGLKVLGAMVVLTDVNGLNSSLPCLGKLRGAEVSA